MIPKKECPSCAMNIGADEKVCPVCGYEFPHQSRIFIAVAVILALIFILLIIRGLL
jgi:predicted nucleic acid-binding Zn ribbon protein